MPAAEPTETDPSPRARRRDVPHGVAAAGAVERLDGAERAVRLPWAPPAAVAAQLRAAGLRVDLLESGLGAAHPSGLGRFSYVAVEPSPVAAADPGGPLRLRAGGPPRSGQGGSDPLADAAALLAASRPSGPRLDPGPFPFRGGAVLALSYELGRRYERLGPAPHHDRAGMPAPPDLHVAIYERVLGFDHLHGEVRLLGVDPREGGTGLSEEQAREALLGAGRLDEAVQPTSGQAHGRVSGQARGQARGRASALRPGARPRSRTSLGPVAYRRAVQSARRLIRQGDLFEVNLSRRHEVEDVDPDRVYAALRALAPGPFMADLDLGHGLRLLSASPERFLSLDAAGRASSWPIKGTRRRGKTPEADGRLATALLASEKDAAELAMIVDLVRNDLGRVARPGSVRVAAPRLLHSWPAVHHTVAVVEADLDAGREWSDLVRAAFPPGSVTGAPKVRAMEVIDALEPVPRGLYCGAFGWVGFDGAMDLAVAIRIVACAGGRAHAHAGGAVLLASDPAGEEREAAAKARALLAALAAGKA